MTKKKYEPSPIDCLNCANWANTPAFPYGEGGDCEHLPFWTMPVVHRSDTFEIIEVVCTCHSPLSGVITSGEKL